MSTTITDLEQELSIESPQQASSTKKDSGRKHWRQNQRLKCYWFILIFSEAFRKQDPDLSKKYKRDQNAIYKLMTIFVNTKNSTQCRTHVQKIKLGEFTDQYLRKMETQFYKDIKILNVNDHRKKQILIHLDQLKMIYKQNKEKTQKVQKIRQKFDQIDFQLLDSQCFLNLSKRNCQNQTNQNLQDQQKNKSTKKAYKWTSKQILIHFLFCQLYKKEINRGEFRLKKIFKKAQKFMAGKKDAGQIRSRYKKIITQWKEMSGITDRQKENFNEAIRNFERVYFKQRLLDIKHMKSTISQYLECLKHKIDQNDMHQFQQKLNQLKWQNQQEEHFMLKEEHFMLKEEHFMHNFDKQSNQRPIKVQYHDYQNIYQQQDIKSQQYGFNSVLISLGQESDI